MEGGSDGKIASPPSGEASRTESSISYWYATRATPLNTWIQRVRGVASEYVTDFAPQQPINEAANKMRILGFIKVPEQDLEADFKKNDADTRKYREDLRRFRAREGIEQEPENPSRIMALVIMLVLFGAETLFSAILFNVNAEGFLQALEFALLLSLVNTTGALAVGHWGVSYFRFSKPPKKYWHLGVLIVGVISLIIFNLFLGHLRDAVAIASDETSFDALFFQGVAAMQRNPLGFQSGQAAFITLLGGVIVCMAMWRGYSGFNDPHPEYSKYNRKVLHAEARQNWLYKRAMREVRWRKVVVTNKLVHDQNLHGRAEDCVRRCRTIALSEGATIEKLKKQTQRRAESRIAAYRGANIRQRMRKGQERAIWSTDLPLQEFDSDEILNFEESSSSIMGVIEGNIKTLNALVEYTQVEAEHALGRIREAHTQAVLDEDESEIVK